MEGEGCSEDTLALGVDVEPTHIIVHVAAWPRARILVDIVGYYNA